MKIVKYLADNLYQIVNLIEAILRVAGAIVPLTPSTKDDVIVNGIKDGFGKIKGFLLQIED